MILPDFLIREWAEGGGIDPFDPENINPASIDLRLGNTISVPRWYWGPLTRWAAWCILRRPDPKKHPELYWDDPKSFERFVLWPGRFVLCHSVEATQIPINRAAMLLSKSSTGRIGLEHLHAGFGDPGFGDNEPSQWTWELVNLAPWPIELIAGRRLTQLVLLKMMARPLKGYGETGRYQGQMGPTAARVKNTHSGGKNEKG